MVIATRFVPQNVRHTQQRSRRETADDGEGEVERPDAQPRPARVDEVREKLSQYGLHLGMRVPNQPLF